MAKGATTFFQAIAGSAIDAEAGIIRGVSVVTEGKAQGHDVSIDSKTLQQALEIASAFKGGLRVKANHGTGVDAIIGTLRNFSISGNKLIADLHLLKSHDEFSHILEMAKEIPESFGLSLTFNMGKEKIEGKNFARVADIYSADLVDIPAANPNGLFNAHIDTPNTDMTFESFIAKAKTVFGNEPAAPATPENFEAKFTASQTELSAATGKLAKFEADLKAANLEVETLKASQSEFDKKVELAASTKAGEIVAKLGVPPVNQPAKENPAKVEDEKPKLTGFAKVQAAFSAQSTK